MKAKKKYSKPKLVSARSKVSLVASIIVCLMFLNACFTVPLEKESCETVVTEFDYCRIIEGRYVDDRGMHIFCANSKSYYVDENYLGYGRQESIEILSKGTELTVTFDSYDGQIVELTAGNEVILSYSDYVQGMEKDRKVCIFFTFFMLMIIGINIIHIYKERHRFD